MSPGQLDEEVDDCCWAPTSNEYIFLLIYIHNKAHEKKFVPSSRRLNKDFKMQTLIHLEHTDLGINQYLKLPSFS